MPSSGSSSLDRLPIGVVLQIDAIARSAERAWLAGEATSIESYLQDCTVEGRESLLEELLLLTADEMKRRGEQPDIAEWTRRFPDFPQAIDRAKAALEALPIDQSRSTPSNEPAPRTPSIRGYSILRELGRGAMGVVYLARQARLQRLVAIKIVAPGLNVSRAFDIIQSEAETIARLRHPNIVQVYEVGQDDGMPFLTIEYIDGESLQQRLARETVPHREAAELIEQLSRAMHHAHAVGVIHRDLKPANILLPNVKVEPVRSSDSSTTHVEGPKITDFGLAKLVDALQE